MRSLARAAAATLGLLLFPAVVWAFFHLLPLSGDLYVWWHARSYVPAVFELEWARLAEGHPEAVGTDEGRREILSLQRLFAAPARGTNDLQDLVADRHRIDVLYHPHPHASGTSFEGTRVRLVPATDDLPVRSLWRVGRTLAVGYGPAVGLTGLALLVSFLTDRKVGCWVYPSVFFLSVQPLFGAFILVTEWLS